MVLVLTARYDTELSVCPHRILLRDKSHHSHNERTQNSYFEIYAVFLVTGNVTVFIPILKAPRYLVLQPLDQSLLYFFVASGGSQDPKIFVISKLKDNS